VNPDRKKDAARTQAVQDLVSDGATGRLFATAAELGVPPVAPGDADLSRIRVLDRESPEGQEELRKRAERKAKHDCIKGRFGMSELGSL
jgi:hypothetical protein